MSSRRTLSWSAALRDLHNDRDRPTDVREERLRSTAGLRGAFPLALSAWRGRSAKRYVTIVLDLDAASLAEAGDAVLIAARRPDVGLAVPVRVTTDLAPADADDWLADALSSGATELHVHRLAGTPEARAAIVRDLTVTEPALPA